DAGFERDPEGRDRARMRVKEMRATEQGRSEQKRHPASAPLFEPAEQDSTKKHLLRDRRKQRGTDQRRQQTRKITLTAYMIDAEHRGDCNGYGKDAEAGAEADEQMAKRLGVPVIVARPLAEPRDHENIQ